MVTYLFGFALLFLALEAAGTEGFGSPATTISVVVFLVTMLCTFAVILFVPLLHILGQWAGYRILKGDDYHYPILGKRLEQWLARRDATR